MALENTVRAVQTCPLEGSASDAATHADALISQVADTMVALNNSLHKNSDIFSVIDGISHQINTLALTTAIAFVSTGANGHRHGFAAVAEEVRNLARTSVEEVKEVRALTDAAIEKVKNGMHLADQAGTTIQQVVGSVRRVVDVVTYISRANQGQLVGIEKLRKTIAEMGKSAGKNTIVVAQAAAIAHSLEKQARELSELIDMFLLQEKANDRKE